MVSEPEAESSSWRDSLYIWDGIVSLHVDPKSTEGEGKDEGKDDSIPVHWEGTWISTEARDATEAAAPKRTAFAEYVNSDFRFDVEGTAKPLVTKAGNAEDKESSAPVLAGMFVATITQGAGWDMEDEETKTKKKYNDTTHDVLVKSLKWSGNMFDQTENLIVAKGENEFGAFVSAGWMRPGNRWTLARRYLPEGDPRAKMSLLELQQAVVDESVTLMEETGQQKLKIPPWQCGLLHAEYQEKSRGEKRKIEAVATETEKQ